MSQVIEDNLVVRTGSIKYWIGRIALGLFGWKAMGEVPASGKFVLVGAPHTSNWDFPIAIAASFVYRIKIHWLGKDSLFHWPFGWLMRKLGGIPIDRSHPHGVVRQLKRKYDESDNLIIVIAAKGTRKKTQYWKSGFYWLAHSAQVPILCSFYNYEKKEVHIGLMVLPSNDIKKDMDILREYFSDMRGKYPELEDNIRLKEEDA
jgi:1-acyl-sn-glycerol-3-phosphate acyltransferase